MLSVGMRASQSLIMLLCLCSGACMRVQTNGLDSSSPGGAALLLLGPTTAAVVHGSADPLTLSIQIQPGSGFYNTAQSIQATASETTALICYSHSGFPACNSTRTLCAAGTTYTVPVSIPSTNSFYAIACSPGFSDSQVAAGSYTIDSVAPTTPTITSSQGISPGGLALTWNSSTDNVSTGSNILYQVCHSTLSNVCNSNATFQSRYGSLQSFGVTFGTMPIGLVYFSVRAVDQAGNASQPSPQGSVAVPP